jgi:hypothetical protein
MKPWYQSLGIWGSIIAVVMSGTNIALNFDPQTGDFSGNLYQLWPSILATVGGFGAWYGRLRAVTQIGK